MIPTNDIPFGRRKSDRRPPKPRVGFSEDFRRFFLRGLAALLPTLITLWLLVKVWDFLWENLGRHLIFGIKWTWLSLADQGFVRPEPAGYIGRYWSDDLLRTKVVGVFVGNLIGRQMWRLAEVAVMKIPIVRAIYPAVKQVTDFVIADKGSQFEGSRVVAVQPHAKEIWSIGLVTGPGLPPLSAATGEDMVTVFVPSSPTAFSGYVLVAPRRHVVELPMTVEEAMRLLVSGGVLVPGEGKPRVQPRGGEPIVTDGTLRDPAPSPPLPAPQAEPRAS